MTSDRIPLSPPEATSVTYKRNFIKTAVCELRFPTLLELEARPPHGFQGKIRKQYPFYEAQVLEQVGAPEPILHEQSYLFRSKDRHWTVTLKSSSLALETSHYLNFADFFERFGHVLDCAKDMLDTDFFTRVGLRYINAIPLLDESVQGWVRPELVAPLTGGVLGTTKSFASVVHGYLEVGEYSLRHGLKRKAEGPDGKTEAPSYSLDFDYSDENVELSAVPKLVEYFNRTNFSFFTWCLGDKAKELLGEGKAK